MAGLSELSGELEQSARDIFVPGTKGRSFSVRGLSMSDISMLLRRRSTDIEAFFSKFSQDEAEALINGQASDAATKFGSELLASAPDLAADVIALASDEPHLTHVVKVMPFPSQLEALEAIGELTFSEPGSLKKVMATVLKFVAGTTTLLNDINQQRIGSMLSERG